MIVPTTPPAVIASMKEAALREMQAEAIRRRVEIELAQQKADAERREILDRQTVCFREAFDASAAKLAEEIGIEPGQVAAVLASIVAGQVPNFRCTFDDELLPSISPNSLTGRTPKSLFRPESQEGRFEGR